MPSHITFYVLLKILLQRQGIVVQGVMGTIEQGDVTLFDCIRERPQTLLVLSEFSKITSPELIPLRGAVAEPLPQGHTGGRVFEPTFHVQGLFFYPAWPKPFHEKAGTIS